MTADIQCYGPAAESGIGRVRASLNLFHVLPTYICFLPESISCTSHAHLFASMHIYLMHMLAIASKINYLLVAAKVNSIYFRLHVQV